MPCSYIEVSVVARIQVGAEARVRLAILSNIVPSSCVELNAFINGGGDVCREQLGHDKGTRLCNFYICKTQKMYI